MLVINYKGKTPQQPFYSIGVKGNNKANKICFIFNAIQQDIDLRETQPYLKVQNKEHSYLDKIKLEQGQMSYDDTILETIWEMTKKSTQYRNLELQLQFQSDNSDEIVWQTQIVEIELSETINADEEVSEKHITEIEQLEKEVATFDNRIKKNSKDIEQINENAIFENDIVDNLESTEATKVLSAKQGKVLNDKINNAISGMYKPQGSSTIQVLNNLQVDISMNGFVFNLLDSGVLTKGSVQVMEGDNVAIIFNEDETDWEWDKLSGLVDLSDYPTKSEVPSCQATATIITNALTNINGRTLTNYEATLGTNGQYNWFTITKGGNDLTEEEASAYMEYMCGSKFVPKYDYEKPINTIFIMANGTFWKPQYDNNSFKLWQVPSPYAILSANNNFTGELKKNNIDVATTEQTFNIINASDIISNTLTQEQYNLITNGKPTLIFGTFLTYKNPLLMPIVISGTSIFRGYAFSETYQFAFQLNPNDRTMLLLSNTFKALHLRSIYGLNGKELPLYPNDNNNYLLKYINGAMAWEKEHNVIKLDTGTYTSGTPMSNNDLAFFQPLLNMNIEEATKYLSGKLFMRLDNSRNETQTSNYFSVRASGLAFDTNWYDIVIQFGGFGTLTIARTRLNNGTY